MVASGEAAGAVEWEGPAIRMPPLPLTGGCQCGTVRYRLTAPPLTLYACHCRECQKQSSSAFGLSMRATADAVVLTGETGIARRPDPDAPPIEGLFCLACGSRLIHRAPGIAVVSIKAGTLDDTSWLVPVGHIWVSSAQRFARPPPGPLVYERQPPNQDALCAAWAAATQL